LAEEVLEENQEIRQVMVIMVVMEHIQVVVEAVVALLTVLFPINQVLVAEEAVELFSLLRTIDY
jgi:hypothetical protein